jgi:polysaccharide chain length determinant protein (PEP-CTERM system associated)
MEQIMEVFELSKYIDIALRRKYWIIITFLLTLLAGLLYILVVPKTYQANALILIQPQKVPQDFVRPVVSGSMDFTVRTIIHQVTSRTNLERIIETHQLYGEQRDTMLIDDKVDLMRSMIKIDIGAEDNPRDRRDSQITSFTIAFQGLNPKKVMDVTNALAYSFITENLKIRESQAFGTTAFLADELASVKRQLSDKEEELKQYSEKYMGGLPEQLQTNLNILERLQAQFDMYDDNLKDAENKKIVIQTQIEEARKNFSILSASAEQDGKTVDLVTLKNQLSSFQARYTDNHPDVIRLKKLIATLEAEQSVSSSSSSSTNNVSGLSGVDEVLRQQLQDIELKIVSLKANIEETNSKIGMYREKVEETPKREQELLSLKRDYQNRMDIYNSLLQKKLEADIALSMEKQQKGEQYKIIDSAKMPMRPVKPDIRGVALLTLILGLGIGVGLAYTREGMDSSFKTPEEAEKELQLPVLLSMPIRYTARELTAQKVKNVLVAASVTMGFLLSAIGLIFATKGIDTTIDYVNNVLINFGVL